jgi:DNA-binding SARP family transcriptional activator
VLTVAVLGRVEVRRDGVPAVVPSGLTTTLLVRLALDAGRPVRVDRLVDDLWPDGTRRNTLQAKVSQLRRALGDPAALPGGPAGYMLAVEPGAVDALEALRLADEGAALLAVGDAAAAAATCRAGVALFATEVLPAAGDAEWARARRVQLEEARLRLTEDELAARMQLGASGEVTGILEALVAAHPLRERLWALLVTALYRAGRQSDALAAHRRVARLLAEELGVDPSPELAVLERQVLTHDRALAPVARRSAESPASHLGNLPGLTAPLVGRTGEVAALVTALDAHRLVTLTGPAGVGKTRLAVEVARHVDAAHGTWLVRLDTARHPDDIAAVVADAVPFVDGPDLGAGLRGAEALLVLDNCEHLIDGVGALVTRVLDDAPHVRVLVTGQRPLGLDGEVVHTLGPLDEPDAVALFTQHAAARGGAPARRCPRRAGAGPAVGR